MIAAGAGIWAVYPAVAEGLTRPGRYQAHDLALVEKSTQVLKEAGGNLSRRLRHRRGVLEDQLLVDAEHFDARHSGLFLI